MPRFELVTNIQAATEDCFALSLLVDAHTASMGRSAERAVGGVTSGHLQLGQTVTWRARHFAFTFRMTSQITAYERPHRFVDQQVRGPFASWWHEHRFDGHELATTMTDVIEYRSPAGPLGLLLDRLLLERYMRRLLEQRNRWLKAQLEDEVARTFGL